VTPEQLALVEFRGAHGTARPGEVPAHTVTAQGTHHGLLVYNGNPGWVRSLDDAAGVVTARDHHSLLVPYYGTGVARQTAQPMSTVTGKDRSALVVTEEDIDACLFRMLQWPELLKAQMMHALPSGDPYQLTARRRDKRGRWRDLSNEQRVKMIGNAVSAPVATMLLTAIVEALTRGVPGGEIEVTDVFCGAGGSSLGMEFVPGVRVTQAINHWDLAVEAHNANFPHADHDVHDIEEIPPSRFRRTPVGWFSPECTHHAYCRGKKDSDEQAQRSRATFNDIVRFTRHHRYDAVIVENVVEARLWCDTRGHPKKCNCGSHFDAWFKSMLDLGYEGRIVYFNSQFALPTPQSRDRMYVVFWRSGATVPNLNFAPPSWCPSCESVVHGLQTWKTPSRGGLRTQPGKFEWGRYGAQYVYTCPGCRSNVAPAVMGAKTIINWDDPGERIGDRDKPLAPNTRKRIRNGLLRLAATEPVVVQVGGHLYERQGYARVWSVDDPLRALHGTLDRALVCRVGGQSRAAGASTGEPTHTITAHDRQVGLVLPAGGQEAQARSNGEPMHTVLGNDRLAMVVAGKSDTVPGDAAEPMASVTGRPHLGVVVQYMENNGGRVDREPLPPVTTGGNHMLVQVTQGERVDPEGGA
jgi:DNA (cytosine-5)-methyltransferase 1